MKKPIPIPARVALNASARGRAPAMIRRVVGKTVPRGQVNPPNFAQALFQGAGVIFKKGRVLRKVPAAKMADELVAEILK